ncbi:MAG: hypothetical protein R2910_04770 [Gemmatimonadales bacterium]
MSRWCILLLLLTASCDRQQTVTVVASIPGLDSNGTATPGFSFVVLPYNRDSLVAAFEARATTPRPATDQLDSLFATFREPFAAYTGLIAEVGQLNDTLAALKAHLDQISRTSEEYYASYATWVALRDSVRSLDKEAARARADLNAARPKFLAQSESLRAAVREWQDSTYRDYDRAVDSIVRATGRPPVADTTDASGVAHVTLRGGPWWVYSRSWDPADPNAEWYWNVPVSSDTVRLNAASGVNRPRY